MLGLARLEGFCLSSGQWTQLHVTEPETDPSELYNIVYLRSVASPTELTQRQPYLRVRVLLTLLINLVRMIDPKVAILLVNDSDARIVVQLLILLVDDAPQIVKWLELQLIQKPVNLNYKRSYCNKKFYMNVCKRIGLC